MNIIDLSNILNEMYTNANDGDKVSMIHLFGIRYAKIIKEKRITANEIIKNTSLNESYATEISKGIRLAKYVIDKEYVRNLLDL